MTSLDLERNWVRKTTLLVGTIVNANRRRRLHARVSWESRPSILGLLEAMDYYFQIYVYSKIRELSLTRSDNLCYVHVRLQPSNFARNTIVFLRVSAHKMTKGWFDSGSGAGLSCYACSILFKIYFLHIVGGPMCSR